jgi:dolichol-phosphate mannosyltransferase
LHQPDPSLPKLTKLSVVIPARDEEGCIASTLNRLTRELRLRSVPHEIVVVDDGSTDKTWEILVNLKDAIPELVPIQNLGPHGFGRAIICGLGYASGDAVVIMMADESDDCRDVIRYWEKLSEGYDCVFGSRFVSGGGTVDYPKIKLILNRLANTFIQWAFGIPLNDTTNAFKAYRMTAIDGCRPLIAPHFNLTVEIPLKAIVRGYSWTTIPITWRNRRTGEAKLKIQEMGSRYLFIILYIWLEKFFSRGDYHRTLHEGVPSDTRSTPAQLFEVRPSYGNLLPRSTAYLVYALGALILLLGAHYNLATAFADEGGGSLFPLYSILGWLAIGILLVASTLEKSAYGRVLQAACLGMGAIFVHAVAVRQGLAVRGGFSRFLTDEVVNSYNLGYGRRLAANFLAGNGFVFAQGEPIDPFRMPGYPAFVALVHAISGRSLDDVAGMTSATIVAQVIVFGLAVGTFVVLFSRLVAFPIAVFGAVLAVCVPLGVIHTQAEPMMPSLILATLGAIGAILARRRAGHQDLSWEDYLLHAAFLIAVFFRHDVLPGWIIVSLLLYWKRPRRLVLPAALFAVLAIPWATYKSAHGHGFTPFPLSIGHVGFVGAFEGPPNDFGLPPSDATVAAIQAANGFEYKSVDGLKFVREELPRFWITYPLYFCVQVISKFVDFTATWYAGGSPDWPAPCRFIDLLLNDGLGFACFLIPCLALVTGTHRSDVLLLLWPVVFQLPLILCIQTMGGRYTSGAFMTLPIVFTALLFSREYWRSLQARWRLAAILFCAGALLWGFRQPIRSALLSWESLRYARPFVAEDFTVIRRRKAELLDMASILADRAGSAEASPMKRLKITVYHPERGQEIARLTLGRLSKGTGIRPAGIVDSGWLEIRLRGVTADEVKTVDRTAWSAGPDTKTADFEVTTEGDYELLLVDGGTSAGRVLSATLQRIEKRTPQPIANRRAVGEQSSG